MIRSADPDLLAAVLDRLHDDNPFSQRKRIVLSPSDPLDELVSTIIAQHTRDGSRAYSALRAAFPTWDDVRDAPEPVLVELLWSSGLARVKARRIKLALTGITERVGALDLSGLADLAPAQAHRWLASVPGIGPKTAACVVLFALGKPVLPVDDHVHRCVTRLGVVPPGLTPAQSHAALEAALGGALRDTLVLHTGLHRLSREVCQAHVPRFDACPLATVCEYA